MFVCFLLLLLLFFFFCIAACAEIYSSPVEAFLNFCLETEQCACVGVMIHFYLDLKTRVFKRLHVVMLCHILWIVRCFMH